MASMLPYIAVICIGYFLGALPFAVIVSRMYGVDILNSGSKNPGATNVKRCVGKTAGNIVFACDFFKGVLAAGWPIWLQGHLTFLQGTESISLLAIIGLASAVVGHSFSVFIKFKGGKGVATTVGGLAAIMWPVLLIGAVVWIAAFYLSRYVSLASILMGFSFPVSAWFLHRTMPEFYLALAVAFFLLIRHRSNISRLIKGTEHKFEKKPKKKE